MPPLRARVPLPGFGAAAPKDEFSAGTEPPRGPSRRTFLEIGALSLAAAAAGCARSPHDTIVPYVRRPEGVVPGMPSYYATTLPLRGAGRPVLVASREGRPVKIEGNPEHPESLGASDAITQAALLGLYDPERSADVLVSGVPSSWEALAARLPRDVAAAAGGVRILTGALTSPLLAAQLERLLAASPGARWHRFEPVDLRAAEREAARALFGRPLDAHYHLERADVIVSLDADLFSAHPSALRHARAFADRRRVGADLARMNRLYAFACAPSPTGAAADVEVPVAPSDVPRVARALLAAVRGEAGPGMDGALGRRVRQAASDLRAAGRAAVVVPGPWQPVEVHLAAHAINAALGALGTGVVFTAPVEPAPGGAAAGSLAELTDAMAAGAVKLLLVLESNPAYTAPAAIAFEDALARVPLRVHLGTHVDETAVRCHVHVPAAHPLEAWSDAVADDGRVGIVQPLVEPLFGGRTAHELLDAALGRGGRSAHDLVREAWQARLGVDAEDDWAALLRRGFLEGSAARAEAVAFPSAASIALDPDDGRGGRAPLEIAFRPDPAIWDGTFANNPWLQELPRPISKLTWDNAALLAPRTAAALGVAAGDEVELRVGGRAVRAAAWPLAGHPEGSVTAWLGHGRRRAGTVGTGTGFDAYRLRPAASPWSAGPLEVVRTGRRRELATTQPHETLAGRDPVRVVPLAVVRRGGTPPEQEVPREDQTLYPAWPANGPRWGMGIDLSSCTGCSACVVACQAENNIPSVGREEVRRGREMHWLRVDRYVEEDASGTRSLMQPVPCMHCETAPCELVCPVAATVHSAEGLNEQVYNRCIGTRYCSNNCPYKVRRFNFFGYAERTPEVRRLGFNPEVTVRSRGVMEKCTYCVQRIEAARHEAIRRGVPLREIEIATACQQACPTRAIVFGDLDDPRSEVAARRRHRLAYGLLAELNTRPRTTYVTRVRNAPDDDGGGEPGSPA